MVVWGTGRWLLWLLAAAVLVWLGARIWPLAVAVLWPFATGVACAAAMERPVRWLQRRGLGRAAAGALCLCGGVVAVGLLTVWLLWTTWREMDHLRHHLPAAYAAAARVLDGVQRLPGRLPPGLRGLATRELQRLYAQGAPLLSHAVRVLQRTATGLPDGAFGLFIVFATAYFACRDRERLAAFASARIPGPWAARLAATAAAVRDSAWGVVRAQLLLALATFVVSLVGLALVGAPYALLAALLAAFFDVLPVVGPALLYGPWIAFLLATQRAQAAGALGLVLLAVGAVRWLLTPQLLGRQTGLHPFAALAAMYVGARLGGVAGLLLGPIAATALAAAWRAPAANMVESARVGGCGRRRGSGAWPLSGQPDPSARRRWM